MCDLVTSRFHYNTPAMELESEMSTLAISHKKRRLSDAGGSEISVEPPSTVSEMEYAQPMEENNMEESVLRRSSRKRASTSCWDASTSNIKPTAPKVNLTLDNNYKEIEKLYLCKTIKKVNSSLETIFEDPQNEKVMSGRKIRRALNFDKNLPCNRIKSKKRVMKAKKVIKQLTKTKVNMAMLLCKLADIENDEGEN